MDLNLENTEDFPLNAATLAQLLDAPHECTMTWTTRDGWPIAMVQLFPAKTSKRPTRTCQQFYPVARNYCW
jgi:hypothetical protein